MKRAALAAAGSRLAGRACWHWTREGRSQTQAPPGWQHLAFIIAHISLESTP